MKLRFYLLSIIALFFISCGSEKDAEKSKVMQLLIPDASMADLEENKKKALNKGVISSNFKDYVPCQLVNGEDTLKAKIRLKGDWTDHLETDRISYRIKLKNDKTYLGLSTFSIQHPKTRNYLHELFMHRLFEREGLLATTYHIIPVKINDEEEKTYAYEGHFDDQFLANNNRPSGPILKFDETSLWEHRARGSEVVLPHYDAAVIEPFDDYEDAKGERKEHFLRALELAHRYKYNDLNVGEIFDLEKAAKYYALLDLGQVSHGLIWHNLRLYYNPESDKLEFVGFDMHAGGEITDPLCFQVFQWGAKKMGFFLEYGLFANSKFREHYTNYLKKYSEESFLDKVFEELNDELDEAENLIVENEEDYEFDRTFYYNSAEKIRASLSSIDEEWDAFFEREKKEKHYVRSATYKNPGDYFLKECSIKAFLEQSDSAYKLKAANYHLTDVVIVGYAIEDYEETVYPLEDSVSLAAYIEDSLSIKLLETQFEPSHLYFKARNTGEELHKVKVYAWPHP